jgi:4-amino-4-deoxy-L-arabinose transferase-like glycosyltransferase
MKPVVRARWQAAMGALSLFLLALSLFLLALIPRLLGRLPLDNTDEFLWIYRTVNFWTAVLQGNWAGTKQSLHPGAVPPWGFGIALLSRFDLAQLQAWRTVSDQVLLDIARTAALFPILLTSLTVVVSYFWLKRLAGHRIALVSAVLLALEPYYLIHSTLVHLDATLASLMFLAALAWLVYLLADGGWPYLLLSGVLAGLAVMTKIPAIYLLPFALLAAGVTYVIRVGGLWGATSGREVGRLGGALVAWVAIAGVTMFAVWPVLWVDGPQTVVEVVQRAFGHLELSYPIPVYFMGQVVDDPGVLYYVLTLGFRLRPLTFVLASLSLLALPLAWRRLQPKHRAALVLGIAYPLFFFLQMSLSGQKQGRYLLPVFPALVVLAATTLVLGLERALRPRAVRFALVPTVVVLVLLSLPWLRMAPHYAMYYNPLLGGRARAVELLTGGGGEGLDLAAAYMNAKPGAENLLVPSFYYPVFDAYFRGESQGPNEDSWAGLPVTADYVVLTQTQVQRNLYPATIHFLLSQQPEHTVRVNGIDYARIYRIPRQSLAGPPPIQHPSGANFENRVRMLGYDASRTATGLLVTLYWQPLASIHADLSVDVRLTDSAGRTLAEVKEPPWSGNVSVLSWRDGVAVRDKHLLPLPAGVPDTGQLVLSLEQQNRDGWSWQLALLQNDETELGLGPVDLRLARPSNPIVEGNLGDVVRLLGYDIGSTRVQAGATLPLTLTWECLDTMDDDYTVFVHLVGADGEPLAQVDSQPLGGSYPTSFWDAGERLRDPYLLELPADLAPGEYELRVGMYLLATGDRLPLYGSGGQSLGDSVRLDTVTITVP